MPGEDLAEMYKVETRRFNEQRSRNMNMFSKDFMFDLTRKEHQVGEADENRRMP